MADLIKVGGTPVYVVKNFIDGDQLKEDLAYSLTNLSDAMMKQASMASYYADLASKATHQVNDIKLKLEIAEAKVYRNTRDAAVTKGEKFTEPYLQSCVTAHPLVIAIKKGLNEAKQVAAMANGAVEAWHQRKDMLVQHGAAERTDKQGELRMLDSKQREELADAAKKRFLDRQKDKAS